MQRLTTRVKICCIASTEEAHLAIRYGAHALGLVGEMPSGPGIVSDEQAREIALALPPGTDSFLLTSRTRGRDIADHIHDCGTTTVQIVQHVDPGEYAELIERAPHTRRVQVIHVEDETALDMIDLYEPWVHAFLLDSGRPSASVPELGGTGRAHDWSISARFVERSSKPVFLAGGLNPGNVREAVEQVRPYGVDLCSGIRTSDYALHEPLLGEFISALVAS